MKSNKPKFIQPDLLLHPNIPKPLHGVNPRTIYGQGWWNLQRNKAYIQNNYCCWACGTHKYQAQFHKWLEAHEAYRIDYEKGTVTFMHIVALCHCCHNYIHSGRLEKLLEKKQISKKKYNTIIKHGDNMLKNANLYKVKHQLNNSLDKTANESNILWKDWRLIIGNNQYKPKFQSFKEWENFYH